MNLVELARRFGYFPPEPMVEPAPMAFPKPFVSERSILTACIIVALGKRNALAQADALSATAYAVRRSEASADQGPAFALAAQNLQHATAAHWGRP